MSKCRIEFYLQDEAATQALAQALAVTQPGAAMVHLQGDLGAGKSTLARAWLRGLGVIGPIPSPTYTLVERYQVADGEVLHLDLYRIADSRELEFLGLDEATPRLWLVEWPERAQTGLPPVDVRLHLAVVGGGRLLSITVNSPLGYTWLRLLANMSVESTILQLRPKSESIVRRKS